jgi:hypothetical protein
MNTLPRNESNELSFTMLSDKSHMVRADQSHKTVSSTDAQYSWYDDSRYPSFIGVVPKKSSEINGKGKNASKFLGHPTSGSDKYGHAEEDRVAQKFTTVTAAEKSVTMASTEEHVVNEEDFQTREPSSGTAQMEQAVSTTSWGTSLKNMIFQLLDPLLTQPR